MRSETGMFATVARSWSPPKSGLHLTRPRTERVALPCGRRDYRECGASGARGLAAEPRSVSREIIAVQHFKVSMNGENFFLTLEGEVRRLGFYTVRFVEAPDEGTAELAVVQMLREDPKLAGVKNTRDDPPMLRAEEITLVPSDQVPARQPGLVFYEEDDNA
jgi:hypothetical protein